MVVHGIWDWFQKHAALVDTPVFCGDVTIEDIAHFDGSNRFQPIYVAIRGVVFDVTKGRKLFGPGANLNL